MKESILQTSNLGTSVVFMSLAIGYWEWTTGLVEMGGWLMEKGIESKSFGMAGWAWLVAILCCIKMFSSTA